MKNCIESAILANIGTEKNVTALDRCATRLRFTIKDITKVNIEEIKKLEGVIDVVVKNTLQVIIGKDVEAHYQWFLDNTKINGVKAKEEIVYNRAKNWQIGLFALNNTATNIFMFLMMYVSYYCVGIAGLLLGTTSMLLTAMRIFDGFTDPLIGFMIDKTNTKFGKFRPAMLLGYVIMFFACIILFTTTHLMPEGFRVIYFVLIYGIYIIGYTFQTACTKAAQACLTNDPEQRPTFSLFDGIYNTLLFAGAAILVANYLEPKHGGFTQGFFNELLMLALIGAGICTILAMIGIAKKDRTEFFGLGTKGPMIKFKDYFDVIKNNRAIQMLIFAASTDKLAGSTMRNTAVVMVIYGVIAGDFGLSGSIAGYTTLPSLLILMVGIQYARKMGQKKALVVSTWFAMGFASILGFMLLTQDMTQLNFSTLNLFTVAYALVLILMTASMNISGNIVIPMIADCADYETYRSGRYVPGMMGTLFSFVDKLISSLAATIVGFAFVAIGFVDSMPVATTPATPELLYVGVFLFIGMPMIGWICSLIAMKFYPLDKEKMNEIQGEIQRIKMESSIEE